MDLLGPLFLFLGLLGWIIFDMLWIRRRSIKINKAEGWSASTFNVKNAKRLVVGMCGAMYLLAIDMWFHPKSPPFTGRLSSIEAFLYDSFGPRSLAVFWAAFATILLATIILRMGRHAK
jgi:hypothetical protein